jgi:hypothetical protein
MMEKPKRIDGYQAWNTERAEKVLLEVWSHLGDFHDHLVLVGGLAPRYLVSQTADNIPRHCGTLDVDLAVSLAVAKVEAYASIRATLERLGLEPGTNKKGNKQRHSFAMTDTEGPIVVDFLTTKYEGPPEVVRAVQSQLSAIQVEGLGLAFHDPELVSVEGKALHGGYLRATLRVCRPVPFVVLKALAFQNRREGKDVHDLLYVLQYAGAGVAEVAASVRQEELEAAAFRHAVETLESNFASQSHDGPIRYAQFLADAPDASSQAYATVREFLQAVRQ